MHHWRDNAFRSLTEAASCASNFQAWAEYARFCELLDRGVRKEALAHLAVFIRQAATWPFAEKKEFISWLYTFIQGHTDTYLLIPHPLYEEFVKWTLAEWTEREPINAEPHRWLGKPEHLKEAIRRNPADEIARRRLTETVINWVAYSIHELPYGYLGDVIDDLQMLKELESIIAEISNEEKRSSYRRQVTEMRESINAYLNRKTET
jgi:hypothetical protein